VQALLRDEDRFHYTDADMRNICAHARITATGNYNLKAHQFACGTVTGFPKYVLAQVQMVTNDSQTVQYEWITGGAGRAGALSVVGWSY